MALTPWPSWVAACHPDAITQGITLACPFCRGWFPAGDTGHAQHHPGGQCGHEWTPRLVQMQFYRLGRGML